MRRDWLSFWDDLLKQSNAVGWGWGMSSTSQRAPWLLRVESIHGSTWGPRGFADPALHFGMEEWISRTSSKLYLVAYSLILEDDMMRAPKGGPGLAGTLCCGIWW